jgi:hypothetical protein
MTTYATFVGGLKDLDVTGVKRVFDGPPKSIPASDLPAMWVSLPEGDDMPITFDGEGGWPTLTVDVNVAVEPIELGTQPENYDGTVTVMDNLQTAIRAIVTGTISKSKLTWTIRGGYATVGQTTYWVVIARITGHG